MQSTKESEIESEQPAEQPVLETPTLAPTATPSQIDFVVENVVQNTGIDDLTIFGLNGEDLVNLLISILILLSGGWLGVFVINGLLWVSERTPAKFDNQILKAVEMQLKWLIALFFLQFATARLAFLSPEWKQWLDLIYYALFVLLITIVVWKLVGYGLKGPLLEASSPQNRDLLIIFTPLLYRSLKVLIFLIALAIIQQKFGFNISALLAVLGIGGLAVSLAAKETFEDVINGFIILLDHPFKIGDRIKVESMDNWGDVESISWRATQIRMLDNRLIVIPNSIIGNSQVENYTSPDTKYRVDITLGIGYGFDINFVIETIENAVLNMPEISKNPVPFVSLQEFGNSAMIFRVYYWLKSSRDIRIRTTVNKAIYQALTEAKIDMPYTTFDVNLAYKEPIIDSKDV